MSDSEILMWQINIENAAAKVSVEYGQSAVDGVFARYDANGFYNLPTCYYSEVFADLEMMAEDN